MVKKLIAYVLLCSIPAVLRAQVFTSPDTTNITPYDTMYVTDLTHILTTRTYLSTKFNSMELNDNSTGESLIYRPNSNVNLGVGFSYRAFTLNLAFGFGFLNNQDDVLGETSYFDAQSNMFSKKLATNLFFQTYQGYYIDSHDRAELGYPADGEKRPYRRDLRQANLGLSSLYIFNNDKFSYRASFTQDAWQKKSAGSWLAGGYVTYFTVRGDSSLVPQALDSAFGETLQIRQGNFLDFGAMGGYAYTLILGKHLFLTASATLGLGASRVNNDLDLPSGERRTRNKWGPGYTFQGRFALGWNSKVNFAGISFNQETSWSAQSENDRFGWSVGNLRVNLVHRFNTGVKPLDTIFEGISKRIKG
jgi:hypothetical protein